MNDIIKDGPAFPQWDGHAITGDPTNLSGGMTIRDYFAGQALAALDLRIGQISEYVSEPIAKLCYGVADAMLNERDRKP